MKNSPFGFSFGGAPTTVSAPSLCNLYSFSYFSAKSLCNLTKIIFPKTIDICLTLWYNSYRKNEREAITMTHAAFNLTTGEVLTSNHANTLKRRVKRNTAWDIAHGLGKGEWVFAHGENWQAIFGAKYSEYCKTLPH